MILSIIVPIFNEKKTVLDLLEKIDDVNLSDLGFEKEIILVDDFSVDGTRDILDNLVKTKEYKIIYHAKNQGKGAAIKTGLQYMSGDFVIIQDADLEYDPQDYRKILEYAIKNFALVVYGSRRLGQNKKYSIFSYYLGGVFLTWVTNFLFGTKITDEATCYKLFKSEVIKEIHLNCERFEFCPEITAKIAKKGIGIHEVPISYYPRSKAEGKKIKWIDGLQALWILIKYRFIN